MPCNDSRNTPPGGRRPPTDRRGSAVTSHLTPVLTLHARGVLYLAVAAICLVLALRLIRHLLIPMGALLQAAAAVAGTALAIVLALLLLVAAVAGA